VTMRDKRAKISDLENRGWAALRRPASVVAALAATTLLAACGSSGSNSSSAAGTSSAASAASTTAAAGATSSSAAASGCDVAGAQANVTKVEGQPTFTPPGPAFDAGKAKGKKVVSIAQDSRIPFNQANEAAMANAAKAAGLQFTAFQNQGQPSQYVQGMQQAISNGANAIDLFATDPRVLQPQIKEAKAHGIKISASQAYDNTQVERYQQITTADAVTTWPYSEAGKVMADYIIANSHCKANVLIIHDHGDVIATPPLVNAMKAEFASKCGSGCKVSESIVSVFDWSTKLQGAAQTAITSNPDLNYMVPIYDSMDQFVIPAIVAAGKTGKIHLVTCSGDAPALKEMQQQGILVADVATSAAWEGYAVMDNILRLLTGTPPLTTQTYPIRMITKANVDQALPNPDKAFGDSYIAGYQKLWGLS
jgi:ribose transport system substrate-binding protein